MSATMNAAAETLAETTVMTAVETTVETTMAQAPSWLRTGEAHRVDPAIASAAFSVDGTRYRITERGAVVSRGDVARPLPLSAFEGVAARAVESEDGSVTVTLELMHADEALSVPVLVADDLHDVAADWRGWARRTGLPMLMVEGDGTIEVLDAAPRPLADAPYERRRRPSRRPRFLVRRQTGSMGVSMRIEGREMFAGV